MWSPWELIIQKYDCYAHTVHMGWARETVQLNWAGQRRASGSRLQRRIAGPHMTSFHYKDEMLSKLNSYLYHLSSGKVGFIVSCFCLVTGPVDGIKWRLNVYNMSPKVKESAGDGSPYPTPGPHLLKDKGSILATGKDRGRERASPFACFSHRLSLYTGAHEAPLILT